MSNIAVQPVAEGAYETAPFVPEPNRYISANVRRGSIIFFDADRQTPNEASKLSHADIAELRAAGHGIIEDVGEPVAGVVTEPELKRKDEYLAAIVADAKAKGDWKTYYENEEASRMASGAYRDFIARQGAAPAPAAALTQW
jgi:hypothetical protein